MVSVLHLTPPYPRIQKRPSREGLFFFKNLNPKKATRRVLFFFKIMNPKTPSSGGRFFLQNSEFWRKKRPPLEGVFGLRFLREPSPRGTLRTLRNQKKIIKTSPRGAFGTSWNTPPTPEKPKTPCRGGFFSLEKYESKNRNKRSPFFLKNSESKNTLKGRLFFLQKSDFKEKKGLPLRVFLD